MFGNKEMSHSFSAFASEHALCSGSIRSLKAFQRLTSAGTSVGLGRSLRYRLTSVPISIPSSLGRQRTDGTNFNNVAAFDDRPENGSG